MASGFDYAGRLVVTRWTAMHLALAVPIIRIFSEEKVHEFYVGFLGFTVDGNTASAISSHCMRKCGAPISSCI
jgi:hypothetical protein